MSKEIVNLNPLYLERGQIRKFRNEDYKSIRSRCLGEGTLYYDRNFKYPKYPENNHIVMERAKNICKRPMFINGTPSRFDALQGQLDDCWAMVAIELITLNRDLFELVVPSDQDFDRNYFGGFHFRIWQQGFWYDVVVDDILPVYKSKRSTLVYAHSRSGDVFWGALLEKAYAKINGVLSENHQHYNSLEEDYPATSLLEFTGGIVENVTTATPLPLAGVSMKYYMNKVYSRMALMSCAIFNHKVDPSTGLVPVHAYAITDVLQCADDDPYYPGLFLVRIMNPHGSGEWRGGWSDDDVQRWEQLDARIRDRMDFVNRNDGEFWMDENDFARYFPFVAVCHLGPAFYMDVRTPPYFHKWQCVSFFGEWVKNVSAGGSDPDYRYMNPQFEVALGWSEENLDADGYVLVDIVGRSKDGRDIKPSIGFFIYLLDYDKKPTLPLLDDYFRNNIPLHHSGFSGYVIRSINILLKLKPGKYAIVPTTEEKGEETEFLLRVFAEFNKLEIVSIDTKISKNVQTEEQSMHENDERIQRIFNDDANDKVEIDWIALKRILDKAMNPNSSLIKSFISFLHHNLKWFYRGNTSDDGSFSKDDCRIMIAMLDENNCGKLDFPEFCSLWKKINFWTVVYKRHRDKTGNLPTSRLREALSSTGYDVNKQIVHRLCQLYSDEQKLLLRDFIVRAVTIEYVLNQYLEEDANEDGSFTFSLEQWVKKTLML